MNNPFEKHLKSITTGFYYDTVATLICFVHVNPYEEDERPLMYTRNYNSNSYSIFSDPSRIPRMEI